MSELWKIHLFKGLRAVRTSHPEQTIARFRTHKTGALLAYLAFYPRAHAREVLVEMFWPDNEPRTGAQNLRTALASLRRQFEPPDVPDGSVLISTRTTIQLNPKAILTDVADFQCAVKFVQQMPVDSEDKIASLARAVNLYEGALLTGIYDEWIGLESQRFEEQYFTLLQELIEALETASDLKRALYFASEGVRRDASRQELRAAVKCFCRLLNVDFETLNLPQTEFGSPQNALKRKPRRKKKITPDLPVLQASEPFPSSPLPRKSLPGILDQFFGREAEVARVCEELTVRKTRLLTFTGIGGSGKTRLAIEAAYHLSQTRKNENTKDDDNLNNRFDRAMYYVSLAELSNSELILGAIFEVMGLPRAKEFQSGLLPGARPVERLCSALNVHPSLLILDNFEHLYATGTPLVELLLIRVPDLQIMVTSQHRLDIPGERELPVGSLSFPAEPLVSPVAKEALAALLEYSSIQLFVDRAQAAASDFQLTSHNASSIAEICRRLEGVPLAIELAGARCSVLSPTQIALRLRGVAEKYATLTTVRRPATMRHASLYTAISWSYELLPPELAKFWARLSIFRGGFPIESAQEVCDQPSAAHWLAQLRASSLVAVEERDGEMRFRMLEMLREFAGEQLETGERNEVSLRHAAHFEKKLSTSLCLLRTSNEPEALLQANLDTDNARAALEWLSAEDSNVNFSKQRRKTENTSPAKALEYSGIAARLALALGTLLQRRGLHTEALKVLETGLQDKTYLQSDNTLHAALLREHSGVLLDLLEWEIAGDSASAMLALSSEAKDKAGIAAATNLIGLSNKGRRQWPLAREHFAGALKQFTKLGDECGIAIVHNNLGLIEYLDEQGDKEAARAHLKQALELRHKLDDVRGVAETHINLGALAQQVDALEEAQQHYESALAIELRLRHSFGVGRALCNLGEITEPNGKTEHTFRLFAGAHALFELTGVAYQKYSATQCARLAGGIEDSAGLTEQARKMARANSLGELISWCQS